MRTREIECLLLANREISMKIKQYISILLSATLIIGAWIFSFVQGYLEQMKVSDNLASIEHTHGEIAFGVNRFQFTEASVANTDGRYRTVDPWYVAEDTQMHQKVLYFYYKGDSQYLYPDRRISDFNYWLSMRNMGSQTQQDSKTMWVESTDFDGIENPMTPNDIARYGSDIAMLTKSFPARELAELDLRRYYEDGQLDKVEEMYNYEEH